MGHVMKWSAPVIVLCFLWMTSPSASAESLFPGDSLVRQRCGACHKPDQQGRLEVIEETRKSPEEWKNVLIRMMRLNGLPLEDALFHPVVKELSDKLCLAPAEMEKVAYYNSDENSQYREIPKDDLEKRLYPACVRCHTFAKIASHRMTKDGWKANRDLHLGYYPTSVFQMREMDWMKESEELIEPLAERFPLDSPEWTAWQADRKDRDISGRWRMAGYQPGFGYYEGTYHFTPNPDEGPDEYTVKRTVRYLNGAALSMSGKASLFGDYHLRYALAPTPMTGRIEGVFDLKGDAMTFTGKWWAVVQDANAYGNEMFARADGDPGIIGVFPQSLKSGAEQQVTLIGVNLPADLSAKDIVFSDGGASVREIETADAEKIVFSVRGGDAEGVTTLSVKGVAYEHPLAVYDAIDGIRIFPDIGRARVSCGAAYPPQGVQFVARAVHFGPDGEPGTADDVILEPVDARWTLAEEVTREDDNDLKYLKAPIENGLYTPVTTYGPMEERKQRREGVGLIAVEAAYSVDGKEATDRALLAVTVPDFITHIK